VFVGGGLLAPWFYWAANGTGILEPASIPPFHRFVNRSMLVVALAGLYLHRLPPQAVIERLSYAVDPDFRSAVLTLRQGAALVERIGEIGPGELFRVEVEYRVPRWRWPS
jgi:hypothetical protein